MTAFTFFSRDFQRRLPDPADHPSKKKATRKRGLDGAFRRRTPTVHMSFAHAVFSGANRKINTLTWVSCSPTHEQRDVRIASPYASQLVAAARVFLLRLSLFFRVSYQLSLIHI